MKEQQVNALLADLASRVPWAIVGFTPQLAAAWKKNKDEVIAAVEERKKELMASQDKGAEPAEPAEPTA